MGRIEESITEFKRTQELEPFSLIANAAIGWAYNFARRYDEAIVQFRKAIELDQHFPLAHLWLGLSYERKSMFDEAIKSFERAVSLSGASAVTLATLGHGYAASGNKVEARKILEKLDDLSNERYVDPFFRATIYAGLGENDRTFEWLQRAYDERSPFLVFLKVDPDLDTLRSDPRYSDLVKKVGLDT